MCRPGKLTSHSSSSRMTPSLEDNFATKGTKKVRVAVEIDLNSYLSFWKRNEWVRLPNFEEKNLDECSVIIFDQLKLFRLIDLIPGFTSYRGPGTKSINWNNFSCSKIITKHQSRFFSQNSAIVPVRLFGRSEYYHTIRLLPNTSTWSSR